MKEKNLTLEFIKNLHTDNFFDAEKTLRSIIEEKLKERMKKEMQPKKKKEKCEQEKK